MRGTMIKKDTVLVLGAGASIPYGFPSGKRLKDEIVQALHPTNQRDQIADLGGFDSSHLEEFFHSLRFSGLTSVDAFLESNSQFLDVGKFMIARTLIPFERVEQLFVPFEAPLDLVDDPRPGNWYEYLWNRMIEDADFDSFGENRLSIVTLNYDRSLEQYLVTALSNAFGESEEDAAERVKQIPVLHVYGKLGNLPWEDEPSEYAPDLGLDRIRRASKGIKILHETAGETEELLRTARDRVKSAYRAVVLGFGFNKANVERLGLLARDDKHTWATRKGLEERELGAHPLNPNRWTFADPNDDCLTLLRKHIGWTW